MAGSEVGRIISADTHIVEPPDLYAPRMPAKFADRAPRMKRHQDAAGQVFDAWFLGDLQVMKVAGVIEAGQRFEDPEKLNFIGGWAGVRKGAYDPHAMIEDLTQDGVWGATVQPSQGLFWYHINDSELLSAICHAYNGWIADFCRPYPGRLRGIGMLNVDNIEEACLELRRCADLGLAGVFIPVAPIPTRPYRSPDYEPLWATAQDVDLPLVLHFLTQRAGVPCDVGLDFDTFTPAGLRATQDYWVRYALADMIFAGVFERYPRLRAGSVEHEISWAPHWLKQMDFTYKERPAYRGFQSKEKMLPSDYWRRNLFATFQEDEVGVQLRDIISADNMLWGNDYPHSESTWPKSREFLRKFFDGVPLSDQKKMVCDNAARLFGFSWTTEAAQ
ncbi:MAG TPA: amidohydrolase family protein [Polyangiaceae bacterium]|nr:amidohydrolase family protein [Polyangiaceae bacterium]